MARFVRLQYSQNKTTAWHDAKKESERERDKQHQVTATATILTRKEEEEDEYEGRIGEKQPGGHSGKATVALTDKTHTSVQHTPSRRGRNGERRDHGRGRCIEGQKEGAGRQADR